MDEITARAYYRRAKLQLDAGKLLGVSMFYVTDLIDAGASDALIDKAAQVNQALARAYELLNEIGPEQHAEFQAPAS